MSYAERAELYRRIEKARGRPLITYVTSSRPQAEGIIAADVIPEICKQLLTIPDAERAVDLLVVSRGGDPTVAYRIVSLLRERFETIGVLVPYEAYSAATLLALGANEIVMHPFSNLGPVDPQLTVVRTVEGRQERQEIASEDIAHFMDFVCNDVGISDQEQKERAFELVAQEVGPLRIGTAKRTSNLTLSLGRKLLKTHMGDDTKVRTISETLNKSFFHHGYPVGRKEARGMGLTVTDPDREMEALMWEVWQDLEAEMECQRPFNPFEYILGEGGRAEPVGVPVQPGMVLQLPSMTVDQLFAICESRRLQREFRVTQLIRAFRTADLNININMVPMSQGWVQGPSGGD